SKCTITATTDMGHTTKRGCDDVQAKPARRSRRHGRFVGLAYLFAAILFASSASHADMIDTSGLKPWEVCGLCHGIDGISRMQKFPKLAGQDQAYLEKQLHDFRAQKRHNDGGQMAAIVTEIKEDEIPDIAAHFSSSAPPKPIETETAEIDLSRARILFESGDSGTGIPACKGCNLPSHRGEIAGPRITAQHPDYLAKQLRDFRTGTRSNDPTGTMPGITSKLTEREIDALAAYIAALPREQG
ncbi:MAG: c-type cytochrome, partial [Pseudomonadota bacterium]